MVCILNKSGTQIPGKLCNYAGTNKTILVLVDGDCGKEIQSYFKKFNIYIFVNNKESIKNFFVGFRRKRSGGANLCGRI